MKSKKALLKKSLLCLIVDKPAVPGLPFAGVDMVQLRDKFSGKGKLLDSAFRLSGLLRKSPALFIVNDHIDIALIAGADGVHLGQEDIPLKQARRLSGKKLIIGVSCHNLEQALEAQDGGADYIGIGPVYDSLTKPGCRAIGLRALRRLKDRIKIPYFAIGNINMGNIGEVLGAGCRRIAVCNAIMGDNRPARAARRLSDRLK
jgi:thiamine-phosphate pyrophosphorylase